MCDFYIVLTSSLCRPYNFRSVLYRSIEGNRLNAALKQSTKQTNDKFHKIYPPDWDALDARPLPTWYDSVKIGIFVVWGVYSVPSVYNEWFWYNWQGKEIPEYVNFMKNNYRPGFTYPDFAPMLTAEFLNTTEWADLFFNSGASYVVFTTKHHDGFTNWPSNYSFNWNSKDIGPKRDIVGELVTSLKKQYMRVGLYHSLFEWFHPLYLEDKANNFATQKFVAKCRKPKGHGLYTQITSHKNNNYKMSRSSNKNKKQWAEALYMTKQKNLKEKTMPELYELVNRYQPDIIWSDGDWEATSKYWNSTQFLSWLYSYSPVKEEVVTNDRWGNDATCKHGGFLTCSDRFNPGKLQKRKWENAMTIDKLSWGYRRNANLDEFLTIDELIATLVKTVSCGGNILINVAPSYDGTIQPLFQERLTQLGQWIDVNAEAIYSSFPWKFQNDTATPNVWYTQTNISMEHPVHAILLDWPKSNTLYLGAPQVSPYTVINLMGTDINLNFTAPIQGGINITIPHIPYDKMPCKWAWVITMWNLKNQ